MDHGENAETGANADGTGRPIEDYALLSDRRCAALVSPEGSIDWFCRPRFDSPAVYARLLDPDAGHWSIRPAGPFTSERGYVGDTFVLRTVFTTDTGTAHLIDAFAIGPSVEAATGIRLRLASRAPRATIRVLECTAGEIEIDFDFKVVPGGRQLKTVASDSPAVRARRLACAMLQDPPAAYPLPFFLVEAARAER